ncbi:rod shape-determining protein MreC [candidate division WOR-3 bacterium]|nr:rod shape-determining protein MreC [candidate division WOR-3 bacterium]
MWKVTDRWFFGLIILCIILIGIGSTEFGEKTQIRLGSIFSPLNSWVSFIFNEFKIRHENKVLRAKVSELALNNQILRSSQYENEKLFDLLEFKARTEYELIASRIVSRDPNPISGTCLIDKGLADEVRKDFPVITCDGVYGKVTEVTRENAIVQTISDFNFRVACMNLRNGIQGIMRWEGGKGCILGQVRVNSDIQIGDSIVTSGLGSIFPKGVAVGKVREINVDKTKLFYEVTLEPTCKLGEIEYVFIVKKKPERLEKSTVYKTPGWEIYQKIEEEKIVQSPLKKSEKVKMSSIPKEEREEFPIEFEVKEPTIRLQPQ